MAKPKKPAQASRHADEARFARAEQACRLIGELFATLFAADEEGQAAQYARMSAVYAKKIRNGKVLNPGDFNCAVDVCTAMRRALAALDATLAFDGHAQQEAILAALSAADGVLADFQKLKAGG